MQTILGLFVLASLLLSAYFTLESVELFYRLLIGLGFGYALTRASMGFAGSVNRLSRAGSSNITSALMMMFALTAILSAFLLYNNVDAYRLNIYPINLGLALGGLLFGFGMSLSSCCATGSLTDLATGFSRAAVTIIFFTMGVFVGFSYQGSASWVKESYLTSVTGESFQGGVYFPDLFSFDGLNGYIGAVMLTLLLASFVIYLAKMYEKKKREDGDYHEVGSEVAQDNTKSEYTLLEKLFVQPWSMRTSGIIVSLLFVVLLWLTHKGWSATSVFGLWFAKVLMFFGLEVETLSEFTTRPVDFFTTPLLESGTSVQNFGIILGAVFTLLLAGSFSSKFVAGLKITPMGVLLFSVGGFLMGFGTRLSNGCNVGALYTPIAEFSLSGWLYLIVVAVGGFTGNWFIKKYISKSCSF